MVPLSGPVITSWPGGEGAGSWCMRHAIGRRANGDGRDRGRRPAAACPGYPACPGRPACPGPVPPGHDHAREAAAAPGRPGRAVPGLGRAGGLGGEPARLGGQRCRRHQRAAEPGRSADLPGAVGRGRHRGQRLPVRRPGAARRPPSLPGRHRPGGRPSGERHRRGRPLPRRAGPGEALGGPARLHRRGGDRAGRQPARPAARSGLPAGGVRPDARHAAPGRP